MQYCKLHWARPELVLCIFAHCILWVRAPAQQNYITVRLNIFVLGLPGHIAMSPIFIFQHSNMRKLNHSMYRAGYSLLNFISERTLVRQPTNTFSSLLFRSRGLFRSSYGQRKEGKLRSCTLASPERTVCGAGKEQARKELRSPLLFGTSFLCAPSKLAFCLTTPPGSWQCLSNQVLVRQSPVWKEAFFVYERTILQQS